jgi:DNA invertase Pin-like site-specific DNA recombinase
MIQHFRCAIYTRKSSEEGLEQSFNSLDAQREACEAYVKSQQHEGWQAIATHYDDGGFSGGSMDRPALRDLMSAIQAGKINVVVVYKVDRLTRSLADFAKLIEQFDKHGVSFVSVTQQFNTTTSMGRLTLNVLLSFAQFEREVTGERIRDKIAASKKKGMWMGGAVPLGYTAGDHKLVLNEAEAATVQTIFREFLRLGNVTALRDWMRENNIVSRGGNYFFRGPLYALLRNPHYIGLIKHKKERYPGEHPAIIDRETWDKAQELLDENSKGGKRKPRITRTSVLAGLLSDAEGTLYTPTHSSKNGRRYRYYTSQAVIQKTEKIEVPARIPAPDLESAVKDRILNLLRDPEDLLAAIRNDVQDPANVPAGFYTKIAACSAYFVTIWQSRSGPDREQFLRQVIDRAIIHPTRVEIRICVPQLIQQLTGSGASFTGGPADQKQALPFYVPPIATIDCPFRHVPQRRALRLIVGSNQITTDLNRQAILKAIARARRWYEQIIAGEVTGLPDIARREKINYTYVKKIFPLALLSPMRVEEIFGGHDSLISLDGLRGHISMQWHTPLVVQVKINHENGVFRYLFFRAWHNLFSKSALHGLEQLIVRSRRLAAAGTPDHLTPFTRRISAAESPQICFQCERSRLLAKIPSYSNRRLPVLTQGLDILRRVSRGHQTGGISETGKTARLVSRISIRIHGVGVVSSCV